MSDQLRDLVELAMRDGHIQGARANTASKTLTVRGKRRIRIRLQSDIFRAVYDPETMLDDAYYPDLALDIMDDVEELRP